VGGIERGIAMNDEKLTFGRFLTEKRISRDITLRGLAAELGVSAVYICDVEKDRKTAPRQEYLEKIAELLHLSAEEQNEMYDLAATTQVRGKAISPDLPDYIMEKDVVRTALRTAKQYNIEDDEWLEFIEKIKKRSRETK
jgi:transcriptional regulator with XRE-family HTH domain